MLRRLERDDMDRAAAVHRRFVRSCALPTLTGLRTSEGDRWYFRELVFAACELWGWFDKQNLFGIIVFCEGWTDQLCVLPSAQDRGIGTARLEVARSRFPRFGLWTFQRNANACRFYERHDFTLVRETDGSANEKKEPDALYERSSGR
jgi:putative acetyltransferase